MGCGGHKRKIVFQKPLYRPLPICFVPSKSLNNNNINNNNNNNNNNNDNNDNDSIYYFIFLQKF